MTLRLVIKGLLLSAFVARCCFAQDPMPVLSSKWERSVHKAIEPKAEGISPARAVLPDDKYFQRKAREQRTDNPMDPNRDSMDARSAAIDKAIQESRASKADDLVGYSYQARVRNDGGKTAKIIFWEYRFAETAHPENVVRRQFLCAVNLRKGDTMELSAFSSLGPSEVISAAALAQGSGRLFDELVQINRIEFSDDTILQRDNWKYSEVKSAIDRATSTPWGKEICRPL